ncbi:MAG: patatin-like phospholipase family protein [Acidimicrobiales bacterium]
MGKLRDLLRRRGGPVAVVLSGGGNHGAVQVGMLRSLVEHEIRPDVVLGCSIGALNGAAYAQDPSLSGVARLEELWRGLDSKGVMPSGWLPNAVAIARKGEAIQGNEALRSIVEGVVDARTFEELTLPFQCVATAVIEVREDWFSSGPLIDPILASAALPAILPSVEIDGVRYLDGAIVNDVPVSRAVELGARTIYVLHCGTIDRPRPDPKRPLDVAVQAYWVARHHRFKRDLASLPDGVEAIVLPTGHSESLRFNDFSRSADLIRAAHGATERFLDGTVDEQGPLPADDRPLGAASGDHERS